MQPDPLYIIHAVDSDISESGSRLLTLELDVQHHY